MAMAAVDVATGWGLLVAEEVRAAVETAARAADAVGESVAVATVAAEAVAGEGAAVVMGGVGGGG